MNRKVLIVMVVMVVTAVVSMVVIGGHLWLWLLYIVGIDESVILRALFKKMVLIKPIFSFFLKKTHYFILFQSPIIAPHLVREVVTIFFPVTD